MTPRTNSPAATNRLFIPVAEVARAHGIRGEVRLKLYHEHSDLLLLKPTTRMRTPEGEERIVEFATVRGTNNGLLAQFTETKDRNAAEALRGCVLLVPRDEFPALEEGEFYACDIEGARVVLPSGDVVGHVIGLVSYPTCEVLAVNRGSLGTLEIPLLDQFVESVDSNNGVVHLVTIEGLA